MGLKIEKKVRLATLKNYFLLFFSIASIFRRIIVNMIIEILYIIKYVTFLFVRFVKSPKYVYRCQKYYKNV